MTVLPTAARILCRQAGAAVLPCGGCGLICQPVAKIYGILYSVYGEFKALDGLQSALEGVRWQRKAVTLQRWTATGRKQSRRRAPVTDATLTAPSFKGSGGRRGVGRRLGNGRHHDLPATISLKCTQVYEIRILGTPGRPRPLVPALRQVASALRTCSSTQRRSPFLCRPRSKTAHPARSSCRHDNRR